MKMYCFHCDRTFSAESTITVGYLGEEVAPCPYCGRNCVPVTGDEKAACEKFPIWRKSKW